MELKEITEEALKLTKKEKTALINALQESVQDKSKADAPKLNIHGALEVFKSVYFEHNGTSYIEKNADYAGIKRLTDCLAAKIAEGKTETFVITDDYIQSVLRMFLNEVLKLNNSYYKTSGFCPLTLASKFNELFPMIKNNSGHERAKRAIDCL